MSSSLLFQRPVNTLNIYLSNKPFKLYPTIPEILLGKDK